MTVRLEHGDMREVLAALIAEGVRVQSIVTDPPYHLTSIVRRFGADGAAPAKVGATGAYARASAGFMGKKWDGGDIAFQPETWRLCWELLPPGGHLLAFSGTRTYHRMVCAIEDAGFEIRDTIAWLYGSGFPKSHNVSKGIDKLQRRNFVQAAIDLGVELPGRSVDDWTKENHAPSDKWWETFKASLPRETWEAIERRAVGVATSGATGWFVSGVGNVTTSATPEAAEWEGWGTALKPALEPICLARKPLVGTVAANVQAHGTGALNIDGCRIEARDSQLAEKYASVNGNSTARKNSIYGGDSRARAGAEPHAAGRWPANVAHDGSEEVVAAFPDGRSAGLYPSESRGTGNGTTYASKKPQGALYADLGTAARFFYSAKADAGDRLGSKHPTVKPVDLMRWLVRLITPPGGTVLDPFAGSGTTGMACLAEGFDCILVEREAEYIADIKRRIAHVRGDDTPLFNKLERGAPNAPRKTIRAARSSRINC